MKGATKRINRDNFHPNHILDSLARGGEIGDKEAKRLLEESCHAHIRLIEKLRAVYAHATALDKLTETI